MTLKFLDEEQHIQVVENLIDFEGRINPNEIHEAGIEYTSLMNSFLAHNMASAKSLIVLRRSENEWFPVSVGYAIARTMFEVNINAHYISQDPKKRSNQYIQFEHVLKYQLMKNYKELRTIPNSQWKEIWIHQWSDQEPEINNRFSQVKSMFTHKTGKKSIFRKWSDLSLWKMAEEVNHSEAYMTMYEELCSYSHADVNLANKYIRLNPTGITWTQKSKYIERANVFRYVATFLTCFLELYGKQLGGWSEDEVRECWNINE